MKKNLKNTQEIRTLVFTGPSLSPEIAQEIMPNAWIHAPAKCGDILKAIRLSPQRIAIIDGYFEQTASLWHKEILFALSLGIEVYGASSMGALRALELEPYGMRGMGKIFELLKKNQSPDDDEVCLAHTEDFSYQTPPMCNIRATFDKAVLNKQLNQKNQKIYIQKIKALPYYERSFSALTGETKLINFCLSHYVDQKKEDAITLLTHLSVTPFSPPKNIQPFAPTLFFYKIFREISATPFEHNYSWLPTIEKQAVIEAKMPYFSAQRRLTKLFQLCYDLAQEDSNSLTSPPTQEFIIGWAKNLHQEYPIAISDNLLAEYLEMYDPFYPSNKNIHRLTVELLKALIGALEKRDLRLYPAQYQSFSNHFRQKNSLFDKEKTVHWLQSRRLANTGINTGINMREDQKSDSINQVDEVDQLNLFNQFIEYITPLYYIVDLNNAHQLGISPSLAAISWLEFTITTPELETRELKAKELEAIGED